MCGITGVVEFEGSNRPVDEKVLERMRDTLVHRGPDDGGLWISEDRRVGFGHRRLSIIDLSPAGHQPMCNKDGSIWITYNGEVYNHARLRKELEAKGHVYRSRTDTETLLYLYEEEGPDFLNRLEGMFALAIWDSRRRELILARDRIGVKPLYYAVLPGTLLFGSEIKAILEHPRMTRGIDRAALYHYLSFVASPAPRTLFQGIHKLPPATRVIVDRHGNMRSETYWDPFEVPPEPEARYDDAGFCATRIRTLLEEAVAKRMMSDVPVGVFLSGGLDSSANVALMARLMDRPVRTFSVGFKDQASYNEFGWAREVARRFRTDHHEVVIDSKDLLDFMPRLIFHQDEPIADWVCVPLHFVSKLARDSGTTVIQVGEGSDEQFFGYEHYLRAFRQHGAAFERIRRLPRPIRVAAYRTALGLAGLLGRGGDRLEMLRRAARDELFFWGGIIAWSEQEKRRLLLPEALVPIGGLSSHDAIVEIDKRAQALRNGADYGQRMIYLELKNRLAELLLMRVDKITMASSIEARVPFLDHKLVEFSMRIPTPLKIQDGRGKYLLRLAMRGILPDSIIDRPKQGFGAPVREWLMGELYGPARDGVLQSRLRDESLFDYDLIGRMFETHRDGRRDHSWHLWTLYNLSRWYDYWIDGQAA